jgi:hypothetical protein
MSHILHHLEEHSTISKRQQNVDVDDVVAHTAAIEWQFWSRQAQDYRFHSQFQARQCLTCIIELTVATAWRSDINNWL